MTTPNAPAQLQHLDPAALTAHPRNVRDDLGDLTGLAASIAAVGVLEPLTVVPLQPIGYLIVAGHRRAAAAVSAGLQTVPCMVRTDWDTDVDGDAAAVEHLEAMLTENLQREGLTAVEEARGVQQLIDLGQTITKVAKRTGLGKKQIALAAGVARLDTDTAAAVDAGGLDLEQAAAVATFADDPEVAAELVEAAAGGPGMFAHALEQARVTRQGAEQVTRLTTELEKAGRTVLRGEYHADLPAGVKSLWNFKSTGPDNVMSAEEHATCPGSAVWVQQAYDSARSTEVCTDPGKYGHVDRFTGSPAPAKPDTPEAKEAAKAERRLVIDNNKAMQAANAVRRSWLKEFLQQRTAPKELLRFCVDTFATGRALDGWLNGLSAGGDVDAAAALGLERPRTYGDVPVTLTSGEQVADGRLPLQLFAHVAAAHEVSINRESWRGTDRRTALVRWLTFLQSQGYTLSDVERTLVTVAAANSKAAA